jgi:hypothetical protein
MAFTFTFIAPPPKPTVNSVTLNTGQGEFAAGDYMLAFIAYDGFAHNRENTMVGWSETTYYPVTLALNDSITFDVSVTSPATHLYVIIKPLTTGTDSDGRWLNGYGWSLFPAQNFIDTATRLQHVSVIWVWHPLHYERFDMKPHGLALDKGAWKVEIRPDSDSSYFYIADFANAVRGSAMIEGQDYIDIGQYGVAANLKIDLADSNYSLCRFEWREGYIYCYAIWNKDSTVYWHGYVTNTRGRCELVIPQSTCVYPLYSYFGKMDCNDYMIKGLSEELAYGRFIFGDDSNMVNFIFDGGFAYENNPLVLAKGGYWSIILPPSGSASLPQEGDLIDNVRFESLTLAVYYNWEIRNSTIYFKYGTYHWLCYPVRNVNAKFVNVTFFVASTYSDANWLDAPAVKDWMMTSINAYMYAAGGVDNFCRLEHYFEAIFNVVNNNGEPIDGATITCLDKDENLVFSVDTGPTGIITEEVLSYYAINKEDNAAGYFAVSADFIELGPFRFTVGATGYETVTYVKDLIEKSSETIVLIESIQMTYVYAEISATVIEDTITAKI